MNKDKYNEIINGKETFKEIADYLRKGQPIMIGWTDEEYTHYDILFVYKTNKEYGNMFQFGLRPTDLFISIMGWSSFGFDINSEKSSGYIAEKLKISGEKTKEKIAELINGVIKMLEEEDE